MPGTLPPRPAPPPAPTRPPPTAGPPRAKDRDARHLASSGRAPRGRPTAVADVGSAPPAGRRKSNLRSMTTPAAPRPTVLLTTSTVPRATSLRREDSLTGRNYSQAVALAGGLPLMAATLDPALAPAYASAADALLLTGGGDVDPELFGAAPDRDLGSVDPERDAFELALYAAFREAGKPVLGVCRGCQVMNV